MLHSKLVSGPWFALLIRLLKIYLLCLLYDRMTSMYFVIYALGYNHSKEALLISEKVKKRIILQSSYVWETSGKQKKRSRELSFVSLLFFTLRLDLTAARHQYEWHADPIRCSYRWKPHTKTTHWLISNAGPIRSFYVSFPMQSVSIAYVSELCMYRYCLVLHPDDVFASWWTMPCCFWSKP